ncbi:MAG: acetyl/propionyl/methylcrotonyl-CoA carboxylase subunit alpha [Gammaproteobacteria bacterium]|nr:MAG: acetyl/propionyl/methylcrotonyl-CoA carboxylase subunit alpha [Gammaproteobacteria bacterium]
MINKILIANRGEIACRVIRTAKRMGIRTVAVYSSADKEALHVKMADEAFHIGPAPSRESYLNGETILEVARKSGADAIHPGYGFLSENADFAEACERAGIIFIGPPAKAIRAMGSKSAAKAIMEEAGVPLIPGYHGENQSPEFLQAQAEKIGYPVLLKAVAGGGGKGMRLVESADAFLDALSACQREAKASFGDDRVLIEKYLVRPRHVEVQVFADRHGNAVYLFERDCSLQRRHQKVIEEAPAPNIDEAFRHTIGQLAVQAAKTIGYVGAGTIEFLYDGKQAYFMEMNTRLQVEHPVTELITNTDLVEWQIRVAAGEALPRTQDDLKIHGHAFEARIYAEDPDNDFLPATGRLNYLRFPDGEHVRVDTGVQEGDEISIYYDPMIAKLIVWGEDRVSALRRLGQALRETYIVGLHNNVRFLRRLAEHPAFQQAELETGFIEKHADSLKSQRVELSEQVIATLALALTDNQNQQTHCETTSDPWSPWALRTGWRLNKVNRQQFRLTWKSNADSEPIALNISYVKNGLSVQWGEQMLNVQGQIQDNCALVNVSGQRFAAHVVTEANTIHVLLDGDVFEFELFNPFASLADESTDGQLVSPMPGAVTSVMVAVGDKVKAGDTLLIIEAMKMEHRIKAPTDGVIEEILYQPGDQVDEGAELVRLTQEAD